MHIYIYTVCMYIIYIYTCIHLHTISSQLGGKIGETRHLYTYIHIVGSWTFPHEIHLKTPWPPPWPWPVPGSSRPVAAARCWPAGNSRCPSPRSRWRPGKRAPAAAGFAPGVGPMASQGIPWHGGNGVKTWKINENHDEIMGKAGNLGIDTSEFGQFCGQVGNGGCK